MSKTSDAADALIQFVDKLQPLNDVAATLKQLGSLDQAVDERKAGLAEVTQQHEQAKSELAKTQDEAAQTCGLAVAEANTTKRAAQDVLVKAKEEAASIVAAAQEQAASTAKTATADAANTLAARDKALESSRKELEDLRNKISAAAAELTDTIAQRDSAQRQLDELKKLAQSIAAPAA